MLKYLFLMGFLSSSFHCLAAELPVIHTPKFQEEVWNFINTQLDHQGVSLSEEVKRGAGKGGFLPFLPAFAFGDWLHTNFRTPGGGEPAAMVGGFFNGIGLAVLFGVIEVPLSVIFAAGGAGYGMLSALNKGIDAKIHEDNFDQQVALNIYNWIKVTKEGRFALRKSIKAWQNEHQETSIKEAVAEIMTSENFNKIFGETEFKEEELKKRLASIDTSRDNWSYFFIEISNQLRIPELEQEEWKKLEEKLINFENKSSDFPELSPGDIREYLSIAVYFFSLANQGAKLSMIRSLIS